MDKTHQAVCMDPGIKQVSWFQGFLISGTWSSPFFRAWLCITIKKKNCTLSCMSLCMECKSGLGWLSPLMMELEIKAGTVILFAHALSCFTRFLRLVTVSPPRTNEFLSESTFVKSNLFVSPTKLA